MKNPLKTILRTALLIGCLCLPVTAGPVKADLGVDFSFGVYGSDSTLEGEVEKWVNTVLSLRAGVFADVLYEMNEKMLVGGEVGYRGMSCSFSSISTDSLGAQDTSSSFSASYSDIPLRAIGRFYFDNLFLQPYLGLLISSASGDVVEDEKGTRVNFDIGLKGGRFRKTSFIHWGYFTELGLVLGPDTHFRVGLGLCVNVLR
jgi:hypothetical protein